MFRDEFVGRKEQWYITTEYLVVRGLELVENQYE